MRRPLKLTAFKNPNLVVLAGLHENHEAMQFLIHIATATAAISAAAAVVNLTFTRSISPQRLDAELQLAWRVGLR